MLSKSPQFFLEIPRFTLKFQGFPKRTTKNGESLRGVVQRGEALNLLGAMPSRQQGLHALNGGGNFMTCWRVGCCFQKAGKLYRIIPEKKTHVRDCPFAILSFAFCLLTHDPAKGLIAFRFFPYIYSIIFPDQTLKIVIFRRSPRFIWIFTTLRFSPKLHPQVVSREIPNLLVNPPYLISS